MRFAKRSTNRDWRTVTRPRSFSEENQVCLLEEFCTSIFCLENMLCYASASDGVDHTVWFLQDVILSLPSDWKCQSYWY